MQQSIKTYQEAKSVRFDIAVQTESGTFYDIEIPFSDSRPYLLENIAFIGNTGIHAGAQYPENEQARQEYRLLSTFEMDAIDRGIQQGMQQGFSNGVRQTARLMKQSACDTDFIVKMTGLSIEEIEAL